MAHAGEELALSWQLKGSVLAGEMGFLCQMEMDGLAELMPRWEESSLRVPAPSQPAGLNGAGSPPL